MKTFVNVIYVKMIFIKICIQQYYLFSVFYFYIGSFILRVTLMQI